MTYFDLSQAIEFVAGKIYYSALPTQPKAQDGVVFFSIDNELIYWNYCLDFGPLNIGHVFRFHEIISAKLSLAAATNAAVVFYSNSHPQRRANAICILSCWGVLFHGMTAAAAFAPFAEIKLPPFHDATDGECTYDLGVRDVIAGLEKGVASQYLSPSSFDVDEYQHYEKVENGDLSWVSRKFIAFAGPHHKFSNKNGSLNLTPEHYIPYFKKSNVTLVVRLNDKCYDRTRFLNAGIDHLDLFYPDGTNAPLPILKQFIEASERTPGVVAVHCKAGLGRTGTCIGAFMMKHHRFTAREVIGWLRLMRPGSVIGPQQQFMEQVQENMWASASSVVPPLEIAAAPLGSPDKKSMGIKILRPVKISRPPMLQLTSSNRSGKGASNPQGDYLVAQKLSHSPVKPKESA